MFLKILLGAAMLIAVFLAFIALQPSDFRVTRTVDIPVTSDVVFAQVNDLHKWEAWSPWAKLDPQAKSTFAGPAAGVGASMTWSGNDKVGEGTMTIVESRPNELVRLKLEFRKPFQATNEAELRFSGDGKPTTVDWSMSGRNNFLFKAVGIFMNCDKMLGDQFDQGLANLSKVSQAAAGQP